MSINLNEIYLLLSEGKKLQIQFKSEGELNYFKIRLHQIKRKNDTVMIELGMMQESESKSIIFDVQKGLPYTSGDGEYTATIKFTDKIVRRTYDVKIVDE